MCAKRYWLVLLLFFSGPLWAQEGSTSSGGLSPEQCAQLRTLLIEGRQITIGLQQNYELKLAELKTKEQALSEREADYQQREQALSERESSHKRMEEALADSETSLTQASESLKRVNCNEVIWRLGAAVAGGAAVGALADDWRGALWGAAAGLVCDGIYELGRRILKWW